MLLGAAVGCLVAYIVYVAGGSTPESNLFDVMTVSEVVSASTWKLGDGSFFALPAFSLPKASLEAVLAIMPVAIATIPESTAHMYQLDVYVNNLAEQKGKEKTDFVKLLDRNLIGDGLCDMIAGVVGGPAGTNYGENISTMAITKVFCISGFFAVNNSKYTDIGGLINGTGSAHFFRAGTERHELCSPGARQ